MKLTAIAVVLAGLSTAQAVHAADTVTVYGIAQLAVTRANDGVTTRMLVEDTGSRIGFKGEDALNGGMKAFFQIESKVGMDDASKAGFANREGWLGLKDESWGKAKLGRGKTYFDLAQEGFDGFNGNSTMINSLLIDGAYYRINNSIAYESPTMSGITGKLQYADMEGKTTGASPRAVIGAVDYEGGPITAVFAFEDQKDLAVEIADGSKATDAGTKIKNYLFGGGYTLPTHTNLKIALRRSQINTNGLSLKRNTFITVLTHPFGDLTARLGFTKLGNIKSSGTQNDTGGTYWALGVDYPLSKRSIVYTEFTQAKNDKNSVNYSELETSAGQSLTARKNSAWTTGLIHLF
ncbi:porin [Chitinimonas sp. PSY-7]|uniref:porin n=1 Tax=Chitinimonas sp. PSY-7 TaxID=3459088 RepID=UPI00403FDF0E